MIKGIDLQTINKNKRTINFRKVGGVIGVLLAVLVLWKSGGVTRRMLQEFNKDKPVENKPTIALPEGWKSLSDNKFQKEKEGYKPTVAVTVSEVDNSINNQAYIDRLIAGAKTTVPSMRIAKNEKISQDKMEGRKLTGHYYNGKTKVNILQKILIVEGKAYTATGSYIEGSESEIETVVDSAISEKMKQN